MPQRTIEERRAYFRQWYAKNRTRWKANVKRRYEANKDEILAKARMRYHGRYRDSKLAKLYGITKEEAQKWLAIHECEICGSTNRRLTLDHDHDKPKGRIRGRLCDNCNRGLGYFKDSPEALENAAQYLRDRQEKAS